MENFVAVQEGIHMGGYGSAFKYDFASKIYTWNNKADATFVHQANFWYFIIHTGAGDPRRRHHLLQVDIEPPPPAVDITGMDHDTSTCGSNPYPASWDNFDGPSGYSYT